MGVNATREDQWEQNASSPGYAASAADGAALL